MRFLHIGLFLYFGSSRLLGQDIHFSQWDKNFMSTSWAEVGNFDGNVRLTGAYRTQWRSVSGVPYLTQALQGEGKSRYPRWAFGGSVHIDKAGDGLWRQSQINVGGSYRWVEDTARVQFRIGFGFTWMQWAWNPSLLQWGNQWNGFEWDAQMPTNEYFDQQNSFYGFHLGGAGSIKWNDKFQSKWSMGAFNLLSNSISMGEDAYHWYPRWVIFQNTRWELNTKHGIEFQTGWYRQGTSKNIMIWIKDKMAMDTRSWNRWGCLLGVGARQSDAMAIQLGGFFMQHEVALSYDLNLSALRMASNGRGALEVTYQWTWKPPKKIAGIKEICPEYY